MPSDQSWSQPTLEDKLVQAGLLSVRCSGFFDANIHGLCFVLLSSKAIVSLGNNMIISNIAIPFYLITISRTLSSYWDIGISRLKNIYRDWKTKIAVVSRVRNSMETKLGQSLELSEVRNKSKLLQWLANCRITKEPPYRCTNTMQMNMPVSMVPARLAWLYMCLNQALAIYFDACREVHTCGYRLLSNHAWMKTNKHDTVENRDMFDDISWMKTKSISPKPRQLWLL